MDEPLDATALWARELNALWQAAGAPTGAVIARQAAAQKPPLKIASSSWSAWLGGQNVPADEQVGLWLLLYLRMRAKKETPEFTAPTDAWWTQTMERARAERRRGRAKGGRPVSRPAIDPHRTSTGFSSVPPLPKSFLPRQALQDQILDALLEEAERADDGQAALVALVGMGGSGKTVLAQAVARDRRVASAFPDGVVWLSAGGRSAAACQALLLAELGVATVGDDVEAGVNALQRRMASARCLVAIDDVTSNEQRAALDVFGPGSALLMTTRDHETVPLGQRKFPIEAVDPEQARQMLATYAGVMSADLPDEAHEVLSRCGGLPLALAICGGMISDGLPWTSLVTMLRKPHPEALAVTFRDYKHTSLAAAIEASTSGLDAQTRELFEELAVFAGRGPVPVPVAARLWAHHGLDSDESQLTVRRLARRSLLIYRPADDTFLLHDLLYAYVLAQTIRRLPDLHCRLATAFLEGWGGLDHGLDAAIRAFDPPAQPSADDLYGLLYLTDHLVQAERDDLLHRLLAAESGPGGRINTSFAIHDRSGRMAEYLLDLELAQSRARRATDLGRLPADRIPGMALEIRYALIRSSIVSLAGKIPAGILAALARHKIWTFNKAQAYAEVIPDAKQRSAALRYLAQFRGLPERRKASLVRLAGQAAAGIDSAMERAFSLVRLVGLTTQDQREAYLESALAAADAESHRAEEIRAWLFVNVAEWFPERVLRELRAGARRRNGAQHYREAMVAALPDLPGLYEDVLAIYPRMRSASSISKAFQAVLLASTPQVRDQLVAERLAAYDPAEEKFGSLIVQELAPYLPGDRLLALLDRALEGEDSFSAVAMLAAAIPHLPDSEKAAAAAKAQGIIENEEVSLQEEEIAALLPLLPEPNRVRLLEQTADALFRKHPASGVWMACTTAPFLPEHLLRRALDHSSQANPPEDALNRLAPYLTPNLLRHFLASRLTAGETPWAPPLVHLAPDQPAGTRSRVLGLVSAVGGSKQRVSLLTALAPDLSGTLITDAVQAFPSDIDPEAEAQLLALLATRAAQPECDALQQRAHDLSASEQHPHHRFHSIVEPAADPQQLHAALHLQYFLERPRLHSHPQHKPVLLPDATIDRAAYLARTLPGPCQHASALATLVPYASPERRAALLLEATVVALTSHDHEDDVPCDALHALKREAVNVPDKDKLPLPSNHLTRVLAPGNPPEHMRQLSCLLAYLPDEERANIAETAMDCLTAMSPDWDKDWISRHGYSGLSAIAPYLNTDARLRAVQLAHALNGSYQTASVLADLAVHASPAARPALLHEAVSYMRTLTRAYLLATPLAKLVSHLDQTQATELLGQLFRLISGDRHWFIGAFPQTIADITPSLTPALLEQAADTVRQHTIARERAQASKALALAAETAIPDPWPTYWRTALANATVVGRPTVLSLIADLPLEGRQDIAPLLIDTIFDIRRWWPSNSDRTTDRDDTPAGT